MLRRPSQSQHTAVVLTARYVSARTDHPVSALHGRGAVVMESSYSCRVAPDARSLDFSHDFIRIVLADWSRGVQRPIALPD